MPEPGAIETSPVEIPETMRAVTQTDYGEPAEVLSLGEVPVPEVAPDRVLVAVEAAAINAYDWHVVAGVPWLVRVAGFGLTKPKYRTPGQDMAGTVVAVGADVEGMSVGDRVFGAANGTAAEYVAALPKYVVAVPEGIPMEEAASVPLAGLTALQAVRDHGKVTAQSNVLVLGASGGVGQFVVQIAKSLGARVTGVCGTHNVDVVTDLGADRVVDYSRDDVYGLDETYDVVVHVNGQYPLGRLRRIMGDDGVLVMVGADEGGGLLGPARFSFGQVARSWFTSQSVAQFVATTNAADLRLLAGMLGDGRLRVAIDHVARLADTGTEISYLREGHARGKVVIDARS